MSVQRNSRGLCLFAGMCVGLVAGTAWAQQHLTATPSGAATWNQMVQREAERLARGWTPARRAIPEPENPLERRKLPEKQGVAEGPAAPLDYRTAPTRNPSLARNFRALADNNYAIPPDTMGAAGPNHLVTMLNTQVRIQSKDGTTASTVSLDAFWTTGTQLNGWPYDPKILYDAGTGRWYATVDADPDLSTSAVWFAISDNNDPTGTWRFFNFRSDDSGATWSDYPGFGYNNKWIAITQNMFQTGGSDWYGTKMWVLDKASLLAGGTLSYTVLPTAFDAHGTLGNQGAVQSFTLKPCVTADPNQDTLYLVDNTGFYDPTSFFQLLRISKLTGTGTSPTWSIVSGSAYPDTGLFKVDHDFMYTWLEVEQAGGPTIDGGDPRVMNAEFRNGRIWLAHGGGYPANTSWDRVAAFWYQLDPNAMPNPIVQSGVLEGGPHVHYYYPAINVNKYNDAVVGFTRSSQNMFASAMFTGRYGFGSDPNGPDKDPPGTMRPLGLLKAGEARYFKDFNSGRNRWGDYSGVSVDPTDNMTFWTILEYAAAASGGWDRWGTWWGEVQVTTDCNHNGLPDDEDIAQGTSHDYNGDGTPDECQTLTPPAITEQPASLTVCPNSPATFSVTAAGSAPFSYQWRKDGAPITGATSRTYTINWAGQGDMGSYDVLVRDACMDPNAAALVSAAAVLTVRVGPLITTEPQGQLVPAGQPVTFTVAASGQSLTYQWRKDQQAIAGATEPNYTIPSVALANRGEYECYVDSACGGAPSAAALLKVGVGAPAEPAPADSATDQDVRVLLSWAEAPAATEYQVYFGSTAQPPLKGTSPVRFFDPGALEYGARYYWKVVAVNTDTSVAGPVWTFTTTGTPPPPPPPPDTPSGPSPADGAVDVPLNVQLGWAATAGADSYKLLLARDAQLSAVRFEGTSVHNYWLYPADLNLQYGTTYYWRIQASNAYGVREGPVWSFTTTAAPSPTAETITAPVQNPPTSEPNEPNTSTPQPTGRSNYGLCPSSGLALIGLSLLGLWSTRRRVPRG